jgi:hypothetical protein
MLYTTCLAFPRSFIAWECTPLDLRLNVLFLFGVLFFASLFHINFLYGTLLQQVHSNFDKREGERRVKLPLTE